MVGSSWFADRNNNAHVLAFDNLSGIPADIADALCRLCTGGGFATRALGTCSFTSVKSILETNLDCKRPEKAADGPAIAHRNSLPRMADHAVWVQACEPINAVINEQTGARWTSGLHLEVYDRNRELT